MADEGDIGERLAALKKRADDISLDQIAKRANPPFAGASSVQRYFTPGGYTKRYLDLATAERLIHALAGLGSPPVTAEDILALTGPRAVPSSIDHDAVKDYEVEEREMPKFATLGSKRSAFAT
jgi:hypothetical protein